MLALVDEELKKIAQATRGFMPEDEGTALYEAGLAGAEVGPLFEIGSYCGRSTVYLGAAASERRATLYTIDHHRGSEEHQPGEEYHEPDLFDDTHGRIDTLPTLLHTIATARLGDVVVPLIGRSTEIASAWSLPLGLVFIDGGHSEDAAQNDYEHWARHVLRGGLLAIHDVFEDPAEGGRPPYNVYLRALESGDFEEVSRCGSLRVLERIGDRI
jgi:predicted O-methyltransferase YrrM